MRRMAAAALVTAVAAALAGCGGGNSPKATYERMWKAAEAGDRDACLACFTKGCQATILELEQAAAELAGDNAEAAKPLDKLMAQAKTSICETGAEKISGETAILLVTIDGKTKPARFVREDGKWRIDISAELVKARQALKLLQGLKGLKDAIEKRKKGK